MTDRPILFSGAMVRAILEDRKTQTRRVLNPQPSSVCTGFVKVFSDPPYFEARKANGLPCAPFPDGRHCVTPYPKIRYGIGDRLWVRETWRPICLGECVWDIDVSYPADGETRRIRDGEFGDKDWNWPKAADRGNVTPLHMPRWASRITLIVTDVRVERLQDISEEDAEAEGWPAPEDRATQGIAEIKDAYPIGWFAHLWDSINGKRSGCAWNDNPWVVAVSFTPIMKNIDLIEGGE